MEFKKGGQYKYNSPNKYTFGKIDRIIGISQKEDDIEKLRNLFLPKESAGGEEKNSILDKRVKAMDSNRTLNVGDNNEANISRFAFLNRINENAINAINHVIAENVSNPYIRQFGKGSETKENPPQKEFYYYDGKKLTTQRSYDPLFHRPYTVMTDENGNKYKFEKESMDMFNDEVEAIPMFRDVSILPNSDGIDISGYNPSWFSQLGNQLTEEGWEATPLVKNMTLEEYYNKHPEYRPQHKKGDKLIVEDSEGDIHVMRIDGMDVNGAYSNKGSNGRAFMPGKWHTNDIDFNTTDPMAMLGYRLSEVGESWDAEGTVVDSPEITAINNVSQIGSIKKSGTPFTFGLNGQVVLPYQEANQDNNILFIGNDGFLLPTTKIVAQKKNDDANKKNLAELDKEGLTKDEREVSESSAKIQQQQKTTTRKQNVKPQNTQQQNNTDNTPKVMSMAERAANLFKHSHGGENLNKYSVRGEVDEGVETIVDPKEKFNLERPKLNLDPSTRMFFNPYNDSEKWNVPGWSGRNSDGKLVPLSIEEMLKESNPTRDQAINMFGEDNIGNYEYDPNKETKAIDYRNIKNRNGENWVTADAILRGLGRFGDILAYNKQLSEYNDATNGIHDAKRMFATIKSNLGTYLFNSGKQEKQG